MAKIASYRDTILERIVQSLSRPSDFSTPRSPHSLLSPELPSSCSLNR